MKRAALAPVLALGLLAFPPGSAGVTAAAHPQAATPTPPAAAAAPEPPRTHLVVVSGIGGAPEYVELFHAQGLGFVEAARESGLPPDRVVWLAEDPTRHPDLADGRSTREALEAEIAALASRTRPADRVLLVLIGHGTADGEAAKLNLPGPDLAAGELAAWLDALPAGDVAVVNTASASGGFLAPLAHDDRIVITATRNAREAERTHFAEFFVAAFSGDGADVDKDGQVSLREAFEFARVEVERRYEREGQLQTEHAVLQGDEALAARFRLRDPGGAGARGAAAAEDPRVAALVAEKDSIETAIAELRARREAMDRSDYEATLEALLVDLAGVNARLDAEGPP